MSVNTDLFLPETRTLEEILMKIMWLSKREMAQTLSRYQMTPPQFASLRCIARHAEGVTMSQLSSDCQAVMPTMTGIIDRLAARGLVSRERDPNDRRSLLIHITSSGKALLEEITQQRREQINEFLMSLSTEERKSILDIMGRYLERLTGWLDTDLEDTHA